MQTYSGGCHCGRVRFRLTADITTATVCNCSMCTRKGIVHLVVEPAQFELLSGEAELSSYRFNTGVAEHRFCRQCGIHPFYTPRSDPGKIDVNVRCLDGVELDELDLRQFDGRNWEQAIATAHWQRGTPPAPPPVLELAVLDLRPGTNADFEAAFARAQSIIASIPGYQRHALRRCAEHESRYLLLVWWDTLESHTVGFRGSPQYREWRALLHHFYDPFPAVEHYLSLPGLEGELGRAATSTVRS